MIFLMYSTYNEGKSVVAERFIRKVRACNSSSYLDYLEKLVDKYNNTVIVLLLKNLLILIILLCLKKGDES